MKSDDTQRRRILDDFHNKPFKTKQLPTQVVLIYCPKLNLHQSWVNAQYSYTNKMTIRLNNKTSPQCLFPVLCEQKKMPTAYIFLPL